MSSKVAKPKVFRTRQTPWSSKDARAFRSAYLRLGKQGVCDAVGGCEYTRVREEWKKYGGPLDLDTFINIRANIGFGERTDELSQHPECRGDFFKC